MPIQHLPASAAPEEIAAILERDGCAVVDRLVAPERLRAVLSEMRSHIEATALGSDEFTGHHTRRIGSLIARSPASRELILDPTVLGTVGRILGHATNFQLHLTQIIALGPGESAQDIHRDQWAFDFFPFPSGYEVQCNTIWAMDDFREENGATRVVVGSHRDEDKKRFRLEDTEPAEMDAGSVFFYTGSLYHAGGANRTDRVRHGLNLTYNVAWLRQEENQYLATPLEVARELPTELQRLMGYARGAYALGYVDGGRDPIEVLRASEGSDGWGTLESARRQLRDGTGPGPVAGG